MVRMVTVTLPPTAEAEVVDLVSALIRFDTSNTGEPETTKGEAICARWVADQLQEVGYTIHYVEAGAPGRGNVFARLEGANPDRGALLLHGHLDVVPLGSRRWSKDPFSGETDGDKLFGRGASDMKAGVAAILMAARSFSNKLSGTPGVVIVLTAAESRKSRSSSRMKASSPPFSAPRAASASRNR